MSQIMRHTSELIFIPFSGSKAEESGSMSAASLLQALGLLGVKGSALQETN